jgi:hypothetical protein
MEAISPKKSAAGKRGIHVLFRAIGILAEPQVPAKVVKAANK